MMPLLEMMPPLRTEILPGTPGEGRALGPRTAREGHDLGPRTAREGEVLGPRTEISKAWPA